MQAKFSGKMDKKGYGRRVDFAVFACFWAEGGVILLEFL
jgi:hypothetical protein